MLLSPQFNAAKSRNTQKKIELNLNISNINKANDQKKTQILLVDDNHANLKLASVFLTESGFEVLGTKSGKQALKTLERASPDLILLDVVMPEMGGFETCRRLKAWEKTKDIPVIFMTAAADLSNPADKVKGLTLGAVDYISKPIQLEEVLARIKIHLHLRSLTKQLSEQNALLQQEIRDKEAAERQRQQAVSEAARNAAALRESEEKFSKAFRSSPIPIAISRLKDARFIEVNDSFLLLLGYERPEVIGHTAMELNIFVNRKDQARIIHLVQHRRVVRNQELNVRTKSGEMMTVLLSAEQIDIDGQACILITANDISDRKRTEEALQRTHAELEQRAAELMVANQELQVTLAELQDAQEELQQQHQELAISRQLVEQERQQYQDLFDFAPDGYVVTDALGVIQEANRATAALLGVDQGFLIGKSLSYFIPAKERPTFRTQLNQLVNLRHSVQSWELNLKPKQDNPFPAAIKVAAVQDVQGNLVGLRWLVRDIRADKQVEAEIIRTKDLFESIFNESTDAIFLVNPETGLIVDCNRPAVELFEAKSKNELLNIEGHTLQKESFTPEELSSIFDEVALKGYWSCELEYVTKKGKLFWGNLAAKQIHVAGQKMNLVRITDITDRKRAELDVQQSEAREREKAQALELAMDELKRTQTQLIQAEKMSSLGRMVAGVAHEINNPVSFIYGNLIHTRQYFQDLLSLTEIYQQTYPNPTPEIQLLVEQIDLEFLVDDWPKLTHSMQVGAERIYEIVRSLRSFSRLDESELKVVDIHEGIDNTLFILQHQLRAEGNRPEIEVIKDYGQLPRVTCYASQLNQVFMNLLSNAIDALEDQPPPRVITIRTTVGTFDWRQQEVKSQTSKFKSMPLSEAKGQKSKSQFPIFQYIMIRITDNGPGMTNDVQKKIFDPFFTTKPVGSGTGLGLSISYQIVVEKHKGQLSCISVPGQGTELIVEIPIDCKAHAVS